ncbi:fatty acid synthase [Coniophora puteana RWD-64-598 SS2]|uniref:Fatty acid synthase n=1 Tax=Coniophora puteana (strain RWD-64-598) TaxID=741705 RepID=A0A5M3MYV4_CONPW|nr:fatty acid synthase [Coniophora puteana RWD-64-598 SS2]EIW84299.1 fatty acid synthase [Coniophora puteana RWD-64-598 SS2]
MSPQNGDVVRENAICTRPLIVATANIRVSIPVSTQTDEWIAAEVLRDDFVQSRKQSDAVDSTAELENAQEALIELHARFLAFVAQNATADAKCVKPRIALLRNIFCHFVDTYLFDKDLYTFVSSFDTEVRAAVLSSFHLARHALEQNNVSDIPNAPPSKLLTAASEGNASIYAIFGGQGTNEVYFDELQALYDTYRPYVFGLISAMTNEILVPLVAEREATGFYTYGMNVLGWLSGAIARPSVEYLASIPVSLPLIGLTQLIQYLVVCRVSGLSPGELRKCIAGATGHSQGVVSAVAISASSTYESYDINAKRALRWLFFCGLRGQEAFPVLAIEPSIIQDSIEGGEGQPTPMLSIAGLSLSEVEPHIAKTNKHLPENSQLGVSLYNGPRNFVVTGPPRALYGLVINLRKVRAPSGEDQSKIPFSQRKPVFTVRFLVVNAPYHSTYLTSATDKLCNEDLAGEELWKSEELAIPVYNTEDGSDMRKLSSSIARSLCDQIFTSPIHWSAATGFPETATHIVDFGPGGVNGIGPLTARNLDGRGVRVITLGDKGRGEGELFDVSNVKREVWWNSKFTPRLVKSSDGTLHLDTPFSRLLGKPPIMVAGMTPTTVKAGFVSAVLAAGYHIELAGGGHYNPAALRSKIAEIQSNIPDGVGITLNSLYINPRQFGFQFPLWQEMRREGLPVEGFCVAAGVPSTEKAAEIIAGLQAAGIKHVSFKPGSIDGIRQVVNIAAANPDFPIIMQWTGGRAGGHHSYEDFHNPILKTYSSIRQHANISLVGGSGFGGADDIWPYLTGEWSFTLYDVQPMPFDGFLFASRVMVAKEAHTSSSVKDLIVAAAGVDDKDWESTYVKPTGGILTVRSELGEPIHKVATRAVKLWKEFDDTVFKMPKDKRGPWLAERKAEIIEKLNANFAKPWFGWKKDGSVALDLGDMTYEEVTLRLIRLMYVSHESRWIDRSLRNLTGDWLRRVEERFAGVDNGTKPSIIQSFSELDEPHGFVETFFSTYPAAKEQLMAAEDRAFFLAISQRPGQKPAPFIPILDSSFEVWFKKDSLWAAEDIEAVFDQDPQRVCILQGPVAVKHSIVKDEPIKDMLGNITSNLIQKLLERSYGGDVANVPTIDYLAPEPASVSIPAGVQPSKAASGVEFVVGDNVPDTNDWLNFLSGSKLNWLKALLTSVTIVQGKAYVDNPMRRALAPRKGQRVVLEFDGELPTSLTAFGAARSHGVHKSDFKAVEIKYSPSTQTIDAIFNEDRQNKSVPLHLQFQYVPSTGSTPIHEAVEGRNHRIKEFYWKLWFGNNETLPEIGLRETFVGPQVTISAEDVETFCSVVGNQGEHFKSVRSSSVKAPMDFAIVTGWQAIMKAIFPASIDGDLLKLVHLSNGFRVVNGSRPLVAGDVCYADARIASVKNTDAGKMVQAKGHVYRDGQPVIEVVSSFLYRGRFTDFENTFDVIEEPDYVVEVASDASVGVIQSKEWFSWADDTEPLKADTTLVFRVKSEVTFKDKTSYRDVSVSGDIFTRDHLKRLHKVGAVEFEQEGCKGNPVIAYLQRHGVAEGRLTPLTNEGYSMTSSTSTAFAAPLTNEPYSKVSGDFNPIHINPYFSSYASLPGTITHGMWSSAATRRYVENIVAQGNPDRVIAYDVSFVGMILPGDELQVKIRHIGMRDGHIVVKVETINQRDEKVLEGTAEVAQPTTVYVFTGQGSQEPGMGMDLYNNSPAARAVWEGADAHLLAVYGFSIVEIVKDNPKQKTIHFGGFKGQAIRQRYMDMTYDTMDKDGNVKTLPLFADIDVRSPKYTFSHPNGLLFATQFAQIALVVTEKAAFEDMRAKGFVQKDCAFAGHSLGEYSALASIADVLHISALVDVVFYRGITMQRAVERDSQNRSNYAMCAVNPSRISKTFTDAALREVVDTISTRTSTLLEIVNYNVEGQQYVCAGELLALQTLTNVLNYLKLQKIDIAKLTETYTVEKVKEMLSDIVMECFDRAKALQAASGYIVLERGFATIPLPGIDVPFHSRYLWAGVMPFRAYLSKKINASLLNPDMLIGKYIPNLVAKPFDVSKEYAELIYDQTSSPRLDKVLKKWEEESWAAPENRQKLAYIILVELLSYQFASPVRWIETQDLLFTNFNFERLIELGPSPTLTGMASRTLKAKYEAQDDANSRKRSILCHAKNVREVYYQFEDEVTEAPAAESAGPAPAAAAAPAGPAPVAAPVAAPAAAAAAIDDVPINASDILAFVIAQKLKKKVEEVPQSKSIKDLVGGKSTLQNEILGDLQLEFSSAPEKGEELSLEELGSALSVGHSGNLGKYTAGLISRMVGGKMPGGFNASTIKGYLSKTWGLGSSRADAVLLMGTTLEPAKRLSSEAEAKAWLDSVVAAYAQRAGISLSSGGAAGAGGGGGGGATINSEEFLKFKSEQDRFAEQHIELYSRYLNRDSRAGEVAFDKEKATSAQLQARLDAIAKEHGDTYIDGIQPVFNPLKARHFDSAWNWVRQDALLMYYDIIHGRLTTVDRELTARCIQLLNRADPELLAYMQYNIDRLDPSKGDTYALTKQFGQELIDNTKEVLGKPPVYKDVTFPTAPHTEVTEKGDIVYTEVVRENVRKLEAYVEEMASGDMTPAVNMQKIQDDVMKLWTVVKTQPGISDDQKNRIKALYEGVVRSLRKNPEQSPRPRQRTRRNSSQFLRPQISSVAPVSADKVPLLHLKRKVGANWEYSSNLTGVYLDILHEIATSGTTFKDKNALLTGVGKGSIGVEILKGLLSGGAHVVITTSRYNRSTVEYYQSIYQSFGARGSALTVVPFNQGSKQDVEALVDYIYGTLGLDLDYILPFAAVPENGREIDGLDDKSELAHRIMLVNLLRILGAVKNKKASHHFVTRPTQVILPLSPNHGLFGNDGLYSESKISLETLFNRWNSESWGEYLCMAGAVIGWTRGTGLMSATNTVAHELEGYGVRTFSAKEMAFNILGLMHPLLFSITQVEPIWADLNGGMDRLPDLADITTRIRLDLNKKSELRRSIARDNALDFKVINGVEGEAVLQTVNVVPRANFKFDFPTLEEASSVEDLKKLQGIIDLEKVVVVTGFAEVGPWGSSRTRWEMEARGEFTIEGCIEMAWIMGFTKYFDGRLKDGSLYVGWVDAKSGEPIDDKDVRGRYEKDILAHAGVRLIEPELFNGYDPKKKVFNQEVELIHDLEPIEVAQSDAEKFKHEHGDKCDIWAGEGDQWFVKFKKGARVFVPKAFKFSRLVAGQIPTGWDAGRYGIPADIIAQVDRATLWALVCTAEALNMSGITDPYELYQHFHPSDVGTCIGSGMGGTESLAKMFKDRREEKEVQNDVLQETFINTTAGWVNLLLMSSSGPVKIPVGACATALQSLEIACDTVLSGKAKVMIAGGFDDISEEGSYEFANMKATSSAETEFAMGREPTEMSRPATTTRAGFMESQGTGVHIVMSAKTAIDLGAPIRGILAFTSTSTDKAGRSIPAPGRGALTVARELPSKYPLPTLDLGYRSRQVAFRRQQIGQWLANEQAQLREELEVTKAQGNAVDDEYISSRVSDMEKEAAHQEKEALATYGMLEGADARVAPLRRALAIWGLSADDIGVLSIHGTSTGANEKNETEIWHNILSTISRTHGNAVPVMAQKSLLGHSKGGSAAWQMAGLIQSVSTGIIPGNRNSDNIDARFEAHHMLMFPSKSIHTDGVRAGVMSSFGFGQVGGIALIVHPRYLFGSLEPSVYESYRARNLARAQGAYKVMTEMMTSNSLVRIKEGPPYTPELEQAVLMNPMARASFDPKTRTYRYTAELNKQIPTDIANGKIVSEAFVSSGTPAGVGVDQVPSWNPTFVSRNFTDAEIAYCRSQPSPPSSFAARWVGKEAVFKSLGVSSKGAGAAMKDIEILPNESGVPTVSLHGEAQAAAQSKGIKQVLISLSHSETVAIAFAQASS